MEVNLYVDDILCDMIDKDLHEILADKFHSTNDVVVKRQIFLALHNFMLSMILHSSILYLFDFFCTSKQFVFSFEIHKLVFEFLFYFFYLRFLWANRSLDS